MQPPPTPSPQQWRDPPGSQVGSVGLGPLFRGPWTPCAKLPPTPAAAPPYLALCHQLPKNSENQVYFPDGSPGRRPSAQPGRLTGGIPAEAGKVAPRAPRFSPQPPPASKPQDIGFPSVWSVKGDKSIGILSSEGVFPFIPLGNEPMNDRSIAYLVQRGPHSLGTSPISS